MRVLFIHDFTVEQWLGGAQIEIEWMREVGKRKGHECLLLTPDNYDREMVKSADLIVLNNIARFSNEEIKWVVSQKPYIKWEHDYSFTLPGRKGFFINLFQHSICNIFLSPLHLNEHLSQIPIQNAKNLVMASPMNVDLFRNMNIERDMDFIYVGRISPVKGIMNVLITAAVNPDKTFYFVGSGPVEKMVKEVPNCRLLGEIPHEKMAEIYSRAKFLIHLPIWKEPFGQIVVQAKLCGCSLILNQNVGAVSFSWFFSDDNKLREILRNIPFEGWETIRKIYEESMGR